MNSPRPDAELLAAFAGDADQAAFAALVERHGPMVLRVAEAILRDRQGAEDIAQATFLVLARKADGLRKSETIAPWLHRVAWRLAIDELRRRQSRQRCEEENVRMNTPTSPVDLSAVHEELGGLPDRYRSPLVLCYLEGEAQETAASQLGLSAPALRKRLERGRELLREKLVRRGVAVGSTGALTALLTAEAGAATLPASFVVSTVQTVTAAGLAGSVTTGVITLGGIIMQAKTVLVVAATAIVLIGGGWLAVKWTTPPETVTREKTAPPRPAPVMKSSGPAESTAPVTPPVTCGLILRQANPPLTVTDSRGRRYAAQKIEDLQTAWVWRHYGSGMDPYFSGVLRLTAAEQIRLQQMLDVVWQGGDAYRNFFEVTESDGTLLVKWKGDAFVDAYRAQRDQVTRQVLHGAREILGEERAEVLGWLPQVGNIHFPNVLPDPAKPITHHQFTVSVTNANGVIAMRYLAKTSTGTVSGQNPGLGPWPALGEQLGVPRQTVLANLAANRQKPSYIKYRDSAQPVDDAPIAAEDTGTGQRYLYVPVPNR